MQWQSLAQQRSSLQLLASSSDCVVCIVALHAWRQIYKICEAKAYWWEKKHGGNWEEIITTAFFRSFLNVLHLVFCFVLMNFGPICCSFLNSAHNWVEQRLAFRFLLYFIRTIL